MSNTWHHRTVTKDETVYKILQRYTRASYKLHIRFLMLHRREGLGVRSASVHVPPGRHRAAAWPDGSAQTYTSLNSWPPPHLPTGPSQAFILESIFSISFGKIYKLFLKSIYLYIFIYIKMESSCSVILKPCNTAVNNTEGSHQREDQGPLLSSQWPHCLSRKEPLPVASPPGTPPAGRGGRGTPVGLPRQQSSSHADSD